MTVKVIKKKPKRVVCKNCGSTLEYDPKDIKEYSGKDISGGPDGAKWIDCPECNKEVILESW